MITKDRPNPNLSAFSAHMRSQSGMVSQTKPVNTEFSQAYQQSYQDAPVEAANDFPSLQTFSARSRMQHQGAVQSPLVQHSNNYAFNNEFPEDIPTNAKGPGMVNKVLVAAILAVMISIGAVIASGENGLESVTKAASNINFNLNFLGTGSVAGISTQSPDAINAAELVKEVGQFTDLPEGEPEILRVQNPESFIDRFPVIYRNLQKDDVIMVYAKKTIIYRPSINKFLAIIPT